NMNSSETDGRTLVVVRNQDWFGATSCDDAIACTLTRTVSSTGEIIDSDIDLNAEDNSFSDDPSRFPGTIDLQTVLAHEVGHVLGFGHSDEAGTLMYATLSPGVESERRALSPDAQAIVCETYPANGCTVVDDRRDTSCGGPWDPPGCGVGGRATDPGALGGMVGLGLVALSRRARRSSRGSRASCRA